MTNAAAIVLGGPSGKFVDANGENALSKLAANTAAGSFTLAGDANFTTAGGFDNNGSLTVDTGSTLAINGKLANVSGTTLTGGSYDVGGILKFSGANVVTNEATIALTSSTAEIVNSSGGANGLANLAVNGATGSFSLSGGAALKTSGAFTNDGTLTIDSASTFGIGGALDNVSGGTLTGGTYQITGTLQAAGLNIVTNAADLTLSGGSAKVLNSTTSANGLANLAVNAAAGTLILANAQSFTSAGAFKNAGGISIGAGSTFKTGGSAAFTQTAGQISDDGTLAAAGGVTLSGGSLLGDGTVTGNLASSGLVTPGVAPGKTGILTDTGAYTQNAGGSLDIAIGGTTAGTAYDVLRATTAVLGGTLNLSELAGFVPTVGSTFKILDFNSETGKFAAVTGLTIDSKEAYTVTYQPTDVLLTVVSTPASQSSGHTGLGGTDISPAHDGRMHATNIVGSGDGNVRLAAALKTFNDAYAVDAGKGIAGANGAGSSRAAMPKRHDALDLIKKAGRR